MSSSTPRCKNLVLDAGPLLSLSPLRGLAETYLTVPQVLAELKDKRARQHFERLGLSAGVKIEVAAPDAASLATVIQWAKKTGDYAVLSHPDLCVLALTYSLHQREKARQTANKPDGAANLGTAATVDGASAPSPTIAEETIVETLTPEEQKIADEAESSIDQDQKIALDADDSELDDDALEEDEDDNQDLEPLDVELQPLNESAPPPPGAEADSDPVVSPPSSPEPLFDDPSDEDDGEGEWITPSNVGLHKSRALDLLPGTGAGRKGKQKAPPEDEVLGAGCMTADFAMQNVLLQMGLNLVGVEGKRIQKVKSWVLRCHACFKICKDNTKKFCPSCGNPTLLRASVTISSPDAASDAPAMQVHLKSNFQYRLRGTKYSIPAPKPGSAKKGTGEGLILREDQTEYVRARKMADGRREREEARMNKGILGREGGAVNVGSWLDPDWMPEMLSVGAGGKGRTMRASGMDGDLPAIGYGRKNPNERKKRK
ncbi:Nin one binding Zn-ribbon like-domain-containing protein [Mycena alexandri]|uniref:20S-pre-rRNA D-site endonuclease NOB1 n=1 Tax=Mycena alexandri TaxID=1745969 RepID=A0AAD6T3K5_9AGAR|nr:Nin one binding Zn-ribbon like-domain-containing protein [Mycena alexandri]